MEPSPREEVTPGTTPYTTVNNDGDVACTNDTPAEKGGNCNNN